MPDGEAILVSGGSSGLGAAVVSAAGEAGYRPLVIDLRAPGPNASDHEIADVSDARSVATAIERLTRRRGGLAAVVTCAGIDRPGPLAQADWEDWQRVIGVNLLGTASVVHGALPHLPKRGGHVVTVASTLGMRAVSDATAYCASKFGVVGFTRGLAAELAGRVKVTLLIPGGMQTQFFDDRSEQYRPGEDADLNDPRRVAQAVLFALAQPDGCNVQELVVTPANDSSWPP
jgi:NADP-dependent 3-hydroxy acid dehydrogenase YdfG